MLTSLAAFFKEMHAGSKNGVVSPGHLFGQVVKQSPKFRGMQQQDSQVRVPTFLDAGPKRNRGIGGVGGSGTVSPDPVCLAKAKGVEIALNRTTLSNCLGARVFI